MTRPSRREVERALEDLEAEHDDSGRLVIEFEEIVVYSGWTDDETSGSRSCFDWERVLEGRDRDPADLEPGDEVVVERTEHTVQP